MLPGEVVSSDVSLGLLLTSASRLRRSANLTATSEIFVYLAAWDSEFHFCEVKPWRFLRGDGSLKRQKHLCEQDLFIIVCSLLPKKITWPIKKNATQFSGFLSKTTIVLVWQSRGVFIFWLFPTHPAGILLPNSWSQIQTRLRTGHHQGCLPGRKEDKRCPVCSSCRGQGRLLLPGGNISVPDIWLCGPAAAQRGHHCSPNVGPFSLLMNRYRDPNINMTLISCQLFVTLHFRVYMSLAGRIFDGFSTPEIKKQRNARILLPRCHHGAEPVV